MTHLRKRFPTHRPVTFVSVGVRGDTAMAVFNEARAYARAHGLTIGSVLLEAVAQYMERVHRGETTPVEPL